MSGTSSYLDGQAGYGIAAFKKAQAMNIAEMGYLQKKPSTQHSIKAGADLKNQKVSTSLFAKWKPRYFLLGAHSTKLEYFLDEADAGAGIDKLGTVDLAGAEFYLNKTTKDKTGATYYDFTIVSQERGLQLRAGSEVRLRAGGVGVGLCLCAGPLCRRLTAGPTLAPGGVRQVENGVQGALQGGQREQARRTTAAGGCGGARVAPRMLPCVRAARALRC
jgi:hypothetical protein